MAQPLKYGENPHQSATFSVRETSDPLAIQRFKEKDGAQFLGSKTSWIALTDLGRLLQVLERFAASFRKNVRDALPPVSVIVKHGSPCGAAFGADSSIVARETWQGDAQAAFGGAMIANYPITKKVAQAIIEGNGGRPPFFSCIAASSIHDDGAALLSAKTKETLFLVNDSLSKIPAELSDLSEVRSVRDLLLEQTSPQFVPDFRAMEHSGTLFSKEEELNVFSDLSLAYAVCSASSSNTISIVKSGMLIGNAVGQQKRVGSARLAVQLARENGHDIKGAVAVSDSFFPFPDALEILADAGVRAIFSTSGSVRDSEVFSAAEKLEIAHYTVPDKEGRMFAGH